MNPVNLVLPLVWVSIKQVHRGGKPAADILVFGMFLFGGELSWTFVCLSNGPS